MNAIAESDERKPSLEEIGRAGERWKAHYAEAFAALPKGTAVIIHVASGEYVTAPDWHLARGMFEQRFGTGFVPAYSFTVGRPIFVGGGLWLK